MNKLAIPLLFIVLIYQSICITHTKKVAIIGAGIAGGSTAYYTNQFVPGTEIHVYEKEGRIGGRMKHVTIGGEICEVGADAWSSVNEYLMELIKELPIPLDNSGYDGNGELGFYEGGGKWLETKRDIDSEAHLYAQIEEFRRRLHQNYETRDKHNTPFRTVEEYVNIANIVEYTNITMNEFGAKHDVKYGFLWGEVLPVIRGIYDQDLNISGFAGIVSLLPALTAAYSVLGGNSLLVEMLINKSHALVSLNTTITDVTKIGNSYQLTSNTGVIPEQFDSVVIANPIEFSGLTFHNINTPPITPRKYVRWFVTLILAKALNPAYFGNIAKMPDNVFTTGNSTAPFVVVYPIAQAKTGQVVFKIFANQDVQSEINNIFIGVADHYVQAWQFTFPDLSPQPSFQPIMWGSGLYYLSGFESVATAMECSTISGRNVALLIASQ